MIIKFNYATPGRLGAEAKLYTKTDYKNREEAQLMEQIVKAFGGADNFENLDACITRLRVTVKNESLVADDATFKKLGAKGIFRSGKGIQVVYGTQADMYKNKIREMYNL
ncbi:MAG: PTS transporter subunit EIIB [Synergistaceae bacterium]|nr:PTS transporter subunit EIIB [Synergistaceae bacterium]